LFAYFGSFGLCCYDFTGQLQWETDFGDIDVFLDFGEGSYRPSMTTPYLLIGITRDNRLSSP
jgi:hypothetical protein